jgi:hypothetical protein
VKELVAMDRNQVPLKLEVLTAADFVNSMMRKDSGALSYSALNTHRDGLFNLFNYYGQTMGEMLESELTNYLKGLKHKLGKDASNGESADKIS